MDDLFCQIECRSNSDSSVMRILRSAMDKAHEKVQSQDGPIEFLHARATFYELAAILVECGLCIVQEEMDILEDSHDKILTDLIEIRHWLQGRIIDMKHLIIEKDRELTERWGNESKLRRALELKERELVYLQENLEPGKMKNDGFLDFPSDNQEIQDGPTEGDIDKLKNSVDQQVQNIKQKLEDKEKKLFTDTRKFASRVSDTNVTFECFDRETNERTGSTEEFFCRVDRLSKMNHRESESSKPDQDIIIRRMSSDIDMLKETLDLAFGKMQTAEMLPLEKQWRCTIEKDIEYILVKGFISNLQRNFDVELRRVALSKDNWSDFVNEMNNLCYELKAFCSSNDAHEKQSGTQVSSNPFPTVRRTSSEPLPDTDCMEKDPQEEETETDGSHYVAKLIKNHESIIQKQTKKWNWLTGEMLRSKGTASVIKIKEDNNQLERRMQDAITRLDNLIKRNHMFETAVTDKINIHEKRRIPKSFMKTNRRSSLVEILEREVEKLKGQKDFVCSQMSLMEDIYELLFRGLVQDIRTELCFKETGKIMKKDANILSSKISSQVHVNEGNQCDKAMINLEDSNSIQISLHYLESSIREDVYMVFLRETVNMWKKWFKDENLPAQKRRHMVSDDPMECLPNASRSLNHSHLVTCPEISLPEFPHNSILQETIASLLKEDVYMVFFREMIEACKLDKDDYAIESPIEEDICQVIPEAVNISPVQLRESKVLQATDFGEATPRSRKLNPINFEEGTPSFRKLDYVNSREGTPRFRKLDIVNSREGTPRFRKLISDNSQGSTPRSRKLDIDGEESLIQKLDSLSKCLEAEEDLMLRASSEIKEHGVNNSLAILDCEEMDERDTIEWLLTDDKSTFTSVSEKLERALQQLYVSKELLVEMEESLEGSGDMEGFEENHSFLEREDVTNVLETTARFQHVLEDFEHSINDSLESKCLRLGVIKHQVETLIQPMALLRKRKLLYKTAFISRCHNLKFAESEVDLLGDQVESLLCLLERIYVQLNQNATHLSEYFEVSDILKSIRKELNNAAVCTNS